MDLKRKMEICAKDIRFVSRADDTDAAVRMAALNALVRLIDEEKSAMNQRLQAKIDSTVTNPS